MRVEAPPAFQNEPAVSRPLPSPEDAPQALAQPVLVATQPPETVQPAPPPPPAMAKVGSYRELMALAGAKRDVLLKLALESQMRPVSFSEGQIEVALAEGADPGVIAMLSARLQQWTGSRWLVTVSSKPPEGMTLREERQERQKAAHAAAHEDPLVQAILETFPGAKVVNVKLRDDAVAPEADAAPPPAEEDEE